MSFPICPVYVCFGDMKEALKTVIFVLVCVFLFILAADGQQPEVNTCPESIDVESLPFFDSWCVENPIDPADRITTCNEFSFLDDTFGCWHSISLPRWYKITTGETGGEITMTVSSDLCKYTGLDQAEGDTVNCGLMTCYYSVFDDCPSNGGHILSYPSNGIGFGVECWDEYSGDDGFIVSSCFQNGCCGWPGGIYCFPDPSPLAPYNADDTNQGEPPFNFPTTNYSITFDLAAATNYYFVIHPSSSTCGSSTPIYSFGCMSVEFDGPAFLDIQNDFKITGPPCKPSFNKPLDEILVSYDMEVWEHTIKNRSPGIGWTYYKFENQIIPWFSNCRIFSEKWDLFSNPMVIIGQH